MARLQSQRRATQGTSQQHATLFPHLLREVQGVESDVAHELARQHGGPRGERERDGRIRVCRHRQL